MVASSGRVEDDPVATSRPSEALSPKCLFIIYITAYLHITYLLSMTSEINETPKMDKYFIYQ